MPPKTSENPSNILIILPSWVGDVVMATPTFRALRDLYPDAKITALAKSYVRPVIEAAPWFDQIIETHSRSVSSSRSRSRGNLLKLAAHLRKLHFDLAVLMPNSFRTALIASLAKIPRRVGYDRDGRGFLLTDRLLTVREGSKFVPVSAVQYYLGIARYLGASQPATHLELFTHPEDDARADQLLRSTGIDLDSSSPLVLLNPGANYGDAKMWYPERFARVADQLIQSHAATILINGSPREKQIIADVCAASSHPLIDLLALGNDLTLLKSICRRCQLVVTNDTGPRHIAAAMNSAVITIFGPTDPRWSEINYPRERHVFVDVFCGPCQKKICPLDHRCMKLVEPPMVLDFAHQLLPSSSDSSSRSS